MVADEVDEVDEVVGAVTEAAPVGEVVAVSSASRSDQDGIRSGTRRRISGLPS